LLSSECWRDVESYLKERRREEFPFKVEELEEIVRWRGPRLWFV